MNNELRSMNSSRNQIRLADVIANIEALNVDPQNTSINLKTRKGMIFTFNWSNRKFYYLRHV